MIGVGVGIPFGNQKAKIYGVSWDKSSSPVLTRTDSAFGMIANAGIDTELVRNDFDRAAIFSEMHEVTDALGNVFIRIPKFYIRKTDGVNLRTWQISKRKYPGFYLPWCFWDFTSSRELPHIDVGKYKATKDGSSRLESKPNLYPLINDNIVNFRTYAQNNNIGGLSGYQQLDIHAVDVLQTLFRVEFATLGSQSVMQGFTAGQYTATHLATVSENSTNRIIVSNAIADLYRVGQTISIGTSQGGNQIFYGRTITDISIYDVSNKAISFDGSPVNIAAGNMLYNTGWKNGFSSGIAASSGTIIADDGKYPCVYRGIESPFGDIWQFVDGVNITDYQAWVCKNAAQYASNVFASPYEVLNYINHNANGYVTQMGFDTSYQFAEFSAAIGGGSTTYYSDYYYQATGQRVARFGGAWNYGSDAGLSCWYLNFASSAAAVSFGGRLLKKPL
jgi:hypothetical protein